LLIVPETLRCPAVNPAAAVFVAIHFPKTRGSIPADSEL
jgi:hypothetical protein